MSSSSSGESPDTAGLLREAFVQIRNLRAELAKREAGDASEPIAILGAGCRFPGGADSLDAFWDVLRAGTDAVTEVPPDRWDIGALYDPDPAAPGKVVTKWGAFLPSIDGFDAGLFGIAPVEAKSLDPQQRLLLEVAWEAFENAGIPLESLRGSKTGVFTGVMYQDYLSRQIRENGLEGIGTYAGTGTTFSTTAGRLSYFYGLQGPSVAVDTACSSSLVAIHLACQALRAGECGMALAGGVNAMLSPEPTVNLSRARMMSPRGRCRTFDAGADGYVRGEGAGLVVLKTLSRARADGDPILGVIRGSAVNQDGRSNGITAPNGQAQRTLLREALRTAGLEAGDIGYIECHGTATPLGDPIEVAALSEVYAADRAPENGLAIGSVKTNFGHLESAAGICGLLKALLVVRHAEVPPHLHLETLNPHLALAPSMAIPTRLTPWFGGDAVRRAAVNAFGFVGTNAHVIVESFAEPDTAPASDAKPELIVLSAQTEPALRELAGRFGNSIEASGLSLQAIAEAAAARTRLPYRLALVADSVADAAARLREKVRLGKAAEAGAPVFLCTGQGSQYAGMGRELYETEPAFRDALDGCAEILAPLLSHSLPDILWGAASSRIDETGFTQPALFALEISLAALWRSRGIVPSALIGHSVGEYAAAHLAGIFSLEDGLKLIAARGRLMQALPPGGGMAAVAAPAAAVKKLCPFLSIAGLNGPEQTVVSGAGAEIEKGIRLLAGQGIAAQRLQVSHAFHSPAMRPMTEAFAAVLREVAFHEPLLPVASNLSGTLARDGTMAAPQYWIGQILAPVRFQEGIQALLAAGHETFLEIGPKPVLAGMGARIAANGTARWLGTLAGPRKERKTFLETAGELFVAGQPLTAPRSKRSGQRRTLPNYPFQRQRYWFDPVERKPEAARVEPAPLPATAEEGAQTGLRFSLMFFAATNRKEADKYRLVIEAARYADRNGFHGIWVPERHFTDMGHLYPSPAILQAALSRETRRLRLMAGSVVAPIHHPARIAEEWAMVDNLSHGRVGISLASGWNPSDFAFFPERYAERQEILYRQVETLRRLWRGEEIEIANGVGQAEQVRIYPEPVQKEFPLWITAAGNPKSFLRAGAAGANLLTHLLDQEVPALAEKIALYRAARAEAGHDPAAGVVTVMVHTFIGSDLETVRGQVRQPFCDYLKASRSLLTGLAHARGRDTDLATFSEKDLDELVNFLFDRFYNTRALIGTPESCLPLLRQLEAAGVNEVASLLDFGPGAEMILGALPDLNRLREAHAATRDAEGLHPAVLSASSAKGAAFADDTLFYEATWKELPPPARAEAATPGHWLILADAGGCGSRLAEALTASGQKCRTLFRRELTEQAFDAVDFVGLRGVVYLWPLDDAFAGQPDAAALEEDLALMTGLPTRLVQALSSPALNGAAPRLWLVTRGAQQAAGDKTVAALSQAALWGFGRVLPTEHPALASALVDLDPGTGISVSIDALRAELLAPLPAKPEREDKIAFRAGRRYGERVVRSVPSPGGPGIAIRPDAAYLVTGGLGGAGLAMAGWLADRGARHLILMGRSPLPERAAWAALREDDPAHAAIRAWQAWEERGVTVTHAQADVSDAAALDSFLQRYRATGPAIRGVVHAAGSWRDQAVVQLTRENLDAVLRPKVRGTWLLHAALARQAEPLDFSILFSSFSSLLPAHGQANYAAANSFLDAFAARERPFPIWSIPWGPWSEVGFGATEKGRQAHERLESFGLHRISPAQGLRVLERIVAAPPARRGVIAIDWKQLARVDRPLIETRWFSELAEVRQAQADSTEVSADSRLFGASLAALPSAGRIAATVGRLGGIVARVLLVEPGQLDPERSLSLMGLDSLMAVEIKNRVQAATGVAVPLVQFLQGTSVAQLAQTVLTELSLALDAAAAEAPAGADEEEILV